MVNRMKKWLKARPINQATPFTDEYIWRVPYQHPHPAKSHFNVINTWVYGPKARLNPVRAMFPLKQQSQIFFFNVIVVER